MNTVNARAYCIRPILAAGFALALALIFTACSSGGDDPGDNGGSAQGGNSLAYSSSSGENGGDGGYSSSGGGTGEGSSSSSSEANDYSSSSSEMDEDPSSSSSEEKSVWRTKKLINYKVSDGAAGNAQIEYDYNYLSYTDDKHYECTYNYTVQTSSEQPSYTMTGYQIYDGHYTMNGETLQMVSNNMTDFTTTYTSNPELTTRTVTVTENNVTYYYDLASGLTSRVTLTGTTTKTEDGVQTVTPSNSDNSYTIQLLSDGDVKTYKYNTSVYEIKDGVTLKTTNYNNDGEITSTLTYAFPDNAVIREKVPTLTVLQSNIYSNGSNGSYQTIELISDSPTLMVVRLKQYDGSNVLISQLDYHYEKFVL